MEVFDALGKELGLRCAILVGGVDMSIQQLQLAAKPHVIISTPGRILDHFSNTKGFSVYKCRFLVLDECDRLLDMDFERDLEQIFKRLNRARQTLLFTATGSSKIKALINRSSRAVMLRCSTDDGQKTNAILKQNVVLTNLSEKNAVLIRLLQKLTQQSIIFCGKVLEVQKLFYICERMQIKAGMIHGQMDQPTRLANLMLLKRREVQVLIATDATPQLMSITNFEWKNPTHLIIKENGSADVADYLKRDGITKVLLAYGGGSVKANGVYDQVVGALKSHGIEIFELSGIRANPEIKTIIAGVDICRKNGIQALLPLGGGSTYDSCKAIAVGACFDADIPSSKVWEIFEGTRAITKALPIYGVLTISATGSEMNNGGVAQDDEQHKKWAFASPYSFPVVSIVDPKVQQSLPWFQQVNGFVDAMVHVMEFLTNVENPEQVETTYAINCALIRSIIKCGDKLQQDNANYEARANFIWAATCALNSLSGMAMKGGCWAVHQLEHAMGAVNPKISHGAGLGVAFPAFVKANASRGLRLQTYARIAKDVFGKEGVEGLIEGFQNVLKKWNHPTTLDQLFGKPMGAAERKQLVDIVMVRPYSGFYPDYQVPRDIVENSFELM